MTGFFPADAVVRRVDGEGVLLLGGGRALLMQLAHPMVAQGVADHSDFRHDPVARLRRTLAASYTVVFGTAAEAAKVGAALHAVHERVVGPGYRANDPDLLLWVHATLVDTALRVHNRFLRPLRGADAERYYEESKAIGTVFGIPDNIQPATLDDFRAYVRDTVGSLVVSDAARTVAHSVLHPRVPLVAEPALELGRQLTAGLLPAPLRAQYGLSWDPARQAALTISGIAAWRLLPWVPPAIRRVHA